MAGAKWERVMGKDKWSGMLEPALDLDLRKFILTCGNFAAATYDAFNSDTNTATAGNSLYTKEELFDKVGLVDASKYRIHKFLYATSGLGAVKAALFETPRGNIRNPWDGDRSSNWIGFVACSSDQQIKATGRLEIFVVLRGTVVSAEWVSNMRIGMVAAEPLLMQSRTARLKLFPDGWQFDLPWMRWNEPQVHAGWMSVYTSTTPGSAYTAQSLRTQIQSAVEELVAAHKSARPSVVLTGHSLGGALATLAGFDLAVNAVAGRDVPVTAFVFSSPMVGNLAFKDKVLQVPMLKVLQTKIKDDPVPKVPGTIGYVAVNTAELEVQARNAKGLTFTPIKTLLSGQFHLHNIELLLYVVAGWNGLSKEFNLQVKRSLALVNKYTGLYKSPQVPEFWWKDKDKKGIVFDKNAQEWVFPK